MATTAKVGETQPPTVAITNTDKPTGLGKPEKPSEEQYQSDLAAAEKELATANEQLVRRPESFYVNYSLICSHLYI